jgi:hypothetical protein
MYQNSPYKGYRISKKFSHWLYLGSQSHKNKWEVWIASRKGGEGRDLGEGKRE